MKFASLNILPNTNEITHQVWAILVESVMARIVIHQEIESKQEALKYCFLCLLYVLIKTLYFQPNKPY